MSKHDDITLKNASSDIMYEISLMEYSLRRYCDIKRILRDPNRQNNEHSLNKERMIFLENFLLHARCLNDFFRLSRLKDDVRTSDYVGDKKAADIIKENEQPDIPDIELINKMLAHITTERANNRQKPWDLAAITEHLTKCLRKFDTFIHDQIENSGRDLLAENWKDFNDYLASLENIARQCRPSNAKYASPSSGYVGI